MKDRLEELQKTIDAQEENKDDDNPCTDEEEEDDVPITSEAVIFEKEPVLEIFLRQAQHIRGDIYHLEAEVNKFSQEQKTLTAVMRSFSMMKKENSVTLDIKLQAESIYKQLDTLLKQVKQTEAKSNPSGTATRIQRSQHAMLLRHFQQVTCQYNETLMSRQEKCKTFIIRQLEISGQETSEEEVDEMVEKGRWKVFSENFLDEAKVTRTQLCEIERRHKELICLESSMKDLHDLFMDIGLLVQEQGEHIENIQAQVEKTQNFTAIFTLTSGQHTVITDIARKWCHSHAKAFPCHTCRSVRCAVLEADTCVKCLH
uniref:Syntaxin 19 n=1 Tax=Paramormyrops kingsleyae TaxID=1676925 RepID=A0A3B3SKM7_9TELE